MVGVRRTHSVSTALATFPSSSTPLLDFEVSTAVHRPSQGRLTERYIAFLREPILVG